MTDGGRLPERVRRGLALLGNADEASEDETPRDGLLSHPGEHHAFWTMLGVGSLCGAAGRPEPLLALMLAAVGLKALPLDRLRDLRREPWYAVGGGTLGWHAPDHAATAVEAARSFFF